MLETLRHNWIKITFLIKNLNNVMPQSDCSRLRGGCFVTDIQSAFISPHQEELRKQRKRGGEGSQINSESRWGSRNSQSVLFLTGQRGFYVVVLSAAISHFLLWVIRAARHRPVCLSERLTDWLTDWEQLTRRDTYAPIHHFLNV